MLANFKHFSSLFEWFELYIIFQHVIQTSTHIILDIHINRSISFPPYFFINETNTIIRFSFNHEANVSAFFSTSYQQQSFGIF